MKWVVIGYNGSNRTAYPPVFCFRFETEAAAQKAASLFVNAIGVVVEVIKDDENEPLETD